MSCGKKAAAQIVLLMAGAAMLCFRRLAGRGGDGAEQSNQTMSGVWALGKKFSGVSQTMSRFRGWIQAGATLLTNLHLPNFLKGGLYQGAGKTVCVPGLNCYSCPAASGPAPSGRFRRWWGLPSSAFPIISQVSSFCWESCWDASSGFLCPFGWFQELLHKIPTKKLSTKKLKPLTYLKYAVLLVMVILLPALLVNVGMGDPSSASTSAPRACWREPFRSPLPIPASGRRWAKAVYMEVQHPAVGDRAERPVLPTLLQVALPAGCVLRAVQPGISLPDEGGQE